METTRILYIPSGMIEEFARFVAKERIKTVITGVHQEDIIFLVTYDYRQQEMIFDLINEIKKYLDKRSMITNILGCDFRGIGLKSLMSDN